VAADRVRWRTTVSTRRWSPAHASCPSSSQIDEEPVLDDGLPGDGQASSIAWLPRFSASSSSTSRCPRCEARKRIVVVGAFEHRPDDLGIEDRAAGGDASDVGTEAVQRRAHVGG
jgi:hypothetical protein